MTVYNNYIHCTYYYADRVQSQIYCNVIIPCVSRIIMYTHQQYYAIII